MSANIPPFEPLREVARRLDATEIEWALGGSGMMHALGLADSVGDWDLAVDVSQVDAHAALRDLSPTLHGNLRIHADHKVVCFDGAVEVICRFAFFRPERYEGFGGSPPSTMGPSTLITIIQGIEIGQSIERNPRVTLMTGAGFTRVALSDLVYAAYGNQIAGDREWTSAFMFAARAQGRLRAMLNVQLTARVVRIGGIEYDKALVMVPVTLGFSF